MKPNRKDVQWRDIWEAVRFGVRQLLQTQAPLMAAALAFRTLFGFLPVLVMGTLIARSFMGAEFPAAVAALVKHAGVDSIQVVLPDSAESGAPPEVIGLGPWIQSLVTYASTIDLTAIGWIGVGVVIFSAIWLMISIEESFNSIYRAPSGRTWMKRLLIYWFVLTVGPVAVSAAPLAMKALAWTAHWADGVPLTARLAGWLLSTGLTWGLLLVAYMTVPNTRVRLHPAMAGALVAAVLLDIGKRFLGVYLENAFSVSRLYGSLGLVPLFMFWVYLMWLFILFGLQISAILQSLGSAGRALASRSHLGMDVFEPASALVALEVMSEKFARGGRTRAHDVASACGMPPILALHLLEQFESIGIAVRTDDDQPCFTLARPAATIDPALALKAAFALIDGGSEFPSHDAIKRLRHAQLSTLEVKSGTPHSGSSG